MVKAVNFSQKVHINVIIFADYNNLRKAPPVCVNFWRNAEWVYTFSNIMKKHIGQLSQCWRKKVWQQSSIRQAQANQ